MLGMFLVVVKKVITFGIIVLVWIMGCVLPKAYATLIPTSAVVIPACDPHDPAGQYATFWTTTVPDGSNIISITGTVCGMDEYSSNFRILLDGVSIYSCALSDRNKRTFVLNNLSGRTVELQAGDFTTSNNGDIVFEGGSVYLGVSLADEEARDAAIAAKTSADAAKTEAVTARTAATTASARVWDVTESKSAATLAKEARDRANAALTEINNVKTAVTNIQASVGPIIQKVATANAATCTLNTTIPVMVQASGATEFRARADTGSWTAWTPVGSPVTVTGITGTGAHVIYVEARNASDTTATGQLTIFKL